MLPDPQRELADTYSRSCHRRPARLEACRPPAWTDAEGLVPIRLSGSRPTGCNGSYQSLEMGLVSTSFSSLALLGVPLAQSPAAVGTDRRTWEQDQTLRTGAQAMRATHFAMTAAMMLSSFLATCTCKPGVPGPFGHSLQKIDERVRCTRLRRRHGAPRSETPLSLVFLQGADQRHRPQRGPKLPANLLQPIR